MMMIMMTMMMTMHMICGLVYVVDLSCLCCLSLYTREATVFVDICPQRISTFSRDLIKVNSSAWPNCQLNVACMLCTDIYTYINAQLTDLIPNYHYVDPCADDMPHVTNISIYVFTSLLSLLLV
ncbi:hypothetical protein F5X96DRAFT_422282 [Biscogniauxia mediterranea]|nr:hypothetical protein F5X96DRAFT_422282 [Biscogniauxia mediterranea]